MTTSPARIAANQRNAAKSTGPRTSEGKQKSRANALKHGLAAETLHTADEVAAVAAIPLEDWRKREAAVLATRIERSHRVEERERELAALRAETCWGADRARDAERIGAGLARRPERVVARLRETVQGCDWLLARWEWLREAAGQPGGWDTDQIALARDLQGMPTSFRARAAAIADPAALVVREVAALREVRAGLEPSDRFGRETAREGLDDAATPGLRRALRYTADLFRRLRWCLDPVPTPTPAVESVETAESAAIAKPAPAPVPAAPDPALSKARFAPSRMRPVTVYPLPEPDLWPTLRGADALPTASIALAITPGPVPRL